ncbi:MAG: hypothetical protein Q7R48_04045 [bacterium]|nr:hypothetical protein [bacterium]
MGSLTTLFLSAFVGTAAYVIGLAVARRFFGVRAYEFLRAVWSLVFALFLNLLLLVTTITWTTNVLAEALRMREGGRENTYIASVIKIGDMVSNYAVIIPLVTVIMGHLFVLSVLIGLRFAVRSVVQWRAPSEMVHLDETHPYFGLAASVVAIPVLWSIYQQVLAWEVLLLRFQFINESRVLRDELGKNWSTTLPAEALNERLGTTFFGQLLAHAGTFYSIAVLVCACLFVLSAHQTLRCIQRMRTPAFAIIPPTLPLEVEPLRDRPDQVRQLPALRGTENPPNDDPDSGVDPPTAHSPPLTPPWPPQPEPPSAHSEETRSVDVSPAE